MLSVLFSHQRHWVVMVKPGIWWPARPEVSTVHQIPAAWTWMGCSGPLCLSWLPSKQGMATTHALKRCNNEHNLPKYLAAWLPHFRPSINVDWEDEWRLASIEYPGFGHQEASSKIFGSKPILTITQYGVTPCAHEAVFYCFVWVDWNSTSSHLAVMAPH